MKLQRVDYFRGDEVLWRSEIIERHVKHLFKPKNSKHFSVFTSGYSASKGWQPFGNISTHWRAVLLHILGEFRSKTNNYFDEALGVFILCVFDALFSSELVECPMGIYFFARDALIKNSFNHLQTWSISLESRKLTTSSSTVSSLEKAQVNKLCGILKSRLPDRIKDSWICMPFSE